jgi:hypothetical protein
MYSRNGASVALTGGDVETLPSLQTPKNASYYV